MRRFSFYRRNGVFYVQFRSPETGLLGPARSTGTRSKDEASVIVAEWLRDGIPEGKTRTRRSVGHILSVDGVLQTLRRATLETTDVSKIIAVLKERGLIKDATLPNHVAETVGSFLSRIWDFEASPYVLERRAHGQRIGRTHCQASAAMVENRWKPALGLKPLSDLTLLDLKQFSMNLSAEGLAPGTINSIMLAGTTPLTWAYNNGLLKENVADGLMRFSGRTLERGVPTPEEAHKLFRVAWKDSRSRTASLVAMTTGLRAGEILALRPEDIGVDRLHIRHSWSPKEGLHATKNGETRIVGLLPVVRQALIDLVEQNPHGRRLFVFYSALEDKPMDKNVLLFGLRDAFVKIGVNPEQRESRHLCFHSWRHYFSTEMANRVGDRAMILTGHKTKTVFEAYAAHGAEREFLKLNKAVEEAFSGLEGSA